MVCIVLCALVAAGCKYIRGLGRAEGSLAGRGINTLSLKVANHDALCPGFNSRLEVVARSYEGDLYNTRNTAGWGNFDISMQGGVVSPRGKLQLNGNPRVTWKRPAVVEAVLVHNPRVRTTLSFEPSYDCAYRAYFNQGRGTALRVEGTLDIIGIRDKKPVARLMLSSDETRRSGTFYLSEGGTVTIFMPESKEAPPGEVRIRVSPSAMPFKKAISLRLHETAEPGVDRPKPKLIFSEEELYLP